MFFEAFTTHFNAIVDHRQSAKVTYPLHDVLFVTLCGVIAGAEGWTDIHFYAESHHDWFKQHGFLVKLMPMGIIRLSFKMVKTVLKSLIFMVTKYLINLA